MSKARKLGIAGLLLVGGYVAAMVLGGAAELVISAPSGETPPAGESTWLSNLPTWLPQSQPVESTGELVLESSPSPERGPTAAAFTNDRPHQPTWLNATSDIPGTLGIADQPAPSAPPLSSESPSLAARPISLSSRSSSQPAPKARITEVRSVAAAAAQPAAASWDRWPRMAENDRAVQEQAVPATFQDLGAQSASAVQASFHESEVVRKNSPPRDPGAMPVDALRTHVVIDGDTLTRLAERYLDDSARAAEIYRLNRDVLANPELLPIGVELRIPAQQRPGDVVASLDPAANLALAPSRSVEARHADAMIPVPWVPKAMEETPQARLLQPVPAGIDN